MAKPLTLDQMAALIDVRERHGTYYETRVHDRLIQRGMLSRVEYANGPHVQCTDAGNAIVAAYEAGDDSMVQLT